MLCNYCDEPVEEGERHPAFRSEPMHRACGLRLIVGSVAHLQGRCSCYVEGSEANDDPKLTKRQAAEEVARFLQRREKEHQPCQSELSTVTFTAASGVPSPGQASSSGRTTSANAAGNLSTSGSLPTRGKRAIRNSGARADTT